MTSLLQIAGTIITILFVGAVLYSLTMTFRKRRRREQRQKDLETKQHVQVANLHQYDIQPQNGYYKYPVTCQEHLRRYPQRFTAISIELANKQPYSICLIGFADFEKGELQDTHYFYVRPPENNLSDIRDPEMNWETLNKADEFGEYWNAGMKNYFINRVLVAHNAAYVIGCITHALKIYGIEAPRFQYIDTLEVAKKLYSFTSHQLDAICHELNIDIEDHNLLSKAAATGQFLITAKKEYPMYIPRIQYINDVPTETEQMASLISVAEREECTVEELFEGGPVNMSMIQHLLTQKYIEPGEKKDTYYATDKGLDFAESLP